MYQLQDLVSNIFTYSGESLEDIETLIIMEKPVRTKIKIPMLVFMGQKITSERIKEYRDSLAAGEEPLDMDENDPTTYHQIETIANKKTMFSKFNNLKDISEAISHCIIDAYESHDKYDPLNILIESCIFYTRKYIYFTVAYDGFFHIDFLPRNPDDVGRSNMRAFGGGSGCSDHSTY